MVWKMVRWILKPFTFMALGWLTFPSVKMFVVVSLPLESSDTIKLADKFSLGKARDSEGNIGIISCQINSSELTLIPSAGGGSTPQEMLQKMTYNTLQRLLDIDFDCLNVNIEARLDKFVLCLMRESYQSTFSMQSEPGKFGTLLLQIPVAVDQACGSAVLFDGIQETRVQFQNSSYSVAAVAGQGTSGRKGGFVIQSGAGAVTAVMIFSLVWNDFLKFQDILLPQRLPELLVVLNTLKSALMPWESIEAFSNDHKRSGTNDIPRFLCAPAFTLDALKKDPCPYPIAWDLLICQFLRSIDFIEVHVAYIRRQKKDTPQSGKADVTNSSSSETTGTPDELLKFEKLNLTHSAVKDDIPDGPIDAAKHLVGDISLYGLPDNSKQAAVPVILIRPTNVMLRVDRSRKDKILKPDYLMKTLKQRLASFSFKSITEHQHIRGSFLRDLEQIINLPDVQTACALPHCTGCFFAQVFHLCVQLRAEALALKLLTDVLKCYDDFWLTCWCDSSHELEVVVAFSSFVNFTKSWDKYPDIMRQLLKQTLRQERCIYVLSDVGLHLLNNGYVFGARETFKFTLSAWKEFVISASFFGREEFHECLLILAIRLHEEDEPQQQVLDELLGLMKRALWPSQLANVVKSLGQHLANETLGCIDFVKKLGILINETCFFGYSSWQFFQITRTFSSIDEKLTTEFWKSLCSQCIQIFNSEEERGCLLCDMLTEKKSIEDQAEMVDNLLLLEESEEALKCSLQKQRLKHQDFDIEEFIEYMDCILLMESDAKLSQVEITENFSALFSTLDLEELIALSTCITKKNLSVICERHSTTRKIAESLLIQISKQGANAIFDSRRESILKDFAWFGDVNLVKTVIDKLDGRIANSACTLKLGDKLSTILAVLRSSADKEDSSHAVSSLLFNREVFNYLMLECLTTLENLTNRSSHCIECFKLLAVSERSFIDSTEPAVFTKWFALSRSLTFSEAVNVVKAIYHSEIVNEGPKLKKFPSCWQVLTELSNSVISKWDLKIAQQLPESDFVSLMQTFFWIGEEKGIVGFQCLISDIPRSVTILANIHRSIIRDERTVDLATSSPHGCLALNDLIDARIEILSRRLAYFLTENTLSAALRQQIGYYYDQKYYQLALPFGPFSLSNWSACAAEAKSFVDKVEAAHRWTDKTEMQKEIEELKALRKNILANIISGSAKPSS